MNRAEPALDHSNAALALRPKDVAIMRARSVALLFLQRPEEVERQLREVTTLAPINIQDEWVLAGVELMRGNA